MTNQVQHKSLPAAQIHAPYRWVVADETARNNLTVSANDIGKRLWQQDTDDEYTLKSTAPAVWINNSSGAVSDHESTYDHDGYDTHVASTSNPHSVTKTQVGLGNVPNEDATDPANWDYGLTGADTTVVTGTAGTDGNLAEWNTDGDLVDSGVATANVMTESRQNLLDRVNRDATLLLDFANNKYRIYEGLSDGNTEKTYANTLTHTRASDTTGVDALGVIQTVTTDTQRLVYSPETGRAEGLLVEESRENLFLHSEDFTNAVWNKSSSSITADAETAPDGTTTADKLVEDGTNNNHGLAYDLSTDFTSGNDYTQSWFVKAAERTQVRLTWRSDHFPPDTEVIFDLTNETVTPGANASGTIEKFKNGFYRVSATATSDSTGSSPNDVFLNMLDAGGNVNYTGDGSSGLYVWGAQLEEASFPTSYIQTTTATVTRSADDVEQTETSKWFNSKKGTVFFVCNIDEHTADSQRFFSLSDGTSNNQIEVFAGATNIEADYVSGGSSTPLDSGVAAAEDTDYRVIVTYDVDAGTFRLTVNGTSVNDTISSEISGINSLKIGASATAADYLNGTVRDGYYIPYALTEAEAIEYTSATETI